MISFDNFSPSGTSPIYLQLVMHIKRGAAAGTVNNGDELPSRRVLSALLGINPNTVQKAFKILEDEELIESRSGAKSTMLLDDAKRARLKAELLNEDIKGIVMSLKSTGIGMDEALKLIEKSWEEVQI